MTAIEVGDAIEAVTRTFELAADMVVLVQIDTEQELWGNTRYHRAREAFRATVGASTPDIVAGRWDRFRRDRQPFTTVYTVEYGDVINLFEVACWPLADVEPAVAVMIHRNLRSEGWASEAGAWVDSWAQPVVVFDRRCRPMHVNVALATALGYEDALPEVAARQIATIIAPVLDAGRPTLVEVPDRFGEPVRMILGRFPRIEVLPSGSTVVSGFFASSEEFGPAPLPAELSEREGEVVRLLLEGLRVRAVAERLYLSTNTVRNHLRSVFAKLGVASQAELIELLRQRP